MSLHTLLEAVKYVEKEETTSTRENTSNKTVLSKGENTVKSPIENGIRRHWRKRAVEQSVLEIQNSGDSSQSVLGTQANTGSGNTSNIEEQSIVKSDQTSTSLLPSYIPHSTKDAPEGQSQLCNSSASNSRVLLTPAGYSYSENIHMLNSSATDEFHGYVNCTKTADAAGESSKLHISGAPCGIANLPRSQKNKIVNTNSVLLKESCHQDSDSADNVTDGNCSEFYKKMNSGYQAQESSPQSAQQSIEENVDSSDDHKTTGASSDYNKKKLPTTSSSIEKMKNQTCNTVTREAHNLLEKNRRAHLKECFENLKQAVPGLGTKKLSNLTILREALKYVQALKRKERKQEFEVDVLAREKIAKQEKLKSLRRKLSEHLSPEAIEDILRNLMVEETSCNSNLSSPSSKVRENPSLSETNSVETIAVGKSSLSELIDQKHDSNGQFNSYKMKVEHRKMNCARPSSSNKDYHSDAQNSSTIDRTLKDQNLCQAKSSESVRFPNPIGVSDSVTFVNGTSSNMNLWPSANLQSQHVALHGLHSNYFSHIESGSCDLSQIPSKFTEGLVFEANISATSHKVQCTKSPMTKVVTSEIPSIVGSGNGRNPMKIVIKPVGNAKHHAQVTRLMSTARTTPERKLANDITKFEKKLPVAKPELVFRQRSSVTPPPPSNITSFFPRFSMGCGGSPPLITVLPDEDEIDTSRKCDSVNSRMESEISEFREWRRYNEDKDEARKKEESFSRSSRKRKSSNSSETTPKQLKDSDKYKSPATPSSITFGLGAGSRRGAETETNATSNKMNFNSQIGFQQISAFRPCPPGLMYSTVLPQGVNHAKSVTQVSYSTLQKASKPAIPSQIITSSSKKIQASLSKSSKDVYDRDKSESDSQELKNSQNVGLKTIESLVMKDSPDEKIGFSEHSSPSHCSVPSQWSGVERHTFLRESSNNTAVSTPVSTMFASFDSQKGFSSVQPVNIAQAQIPQFQYVIPMGYMTYPGMIGAAGAASPQLGFSPAMGSFMPIAPLSQGQGWGYVMPQNMMITPTKQNVCVASKSSDIPTENSSHSTVSSNIVSHSSLALHSVSPSTNNSQSNQKQTDHCTKTSDKLQTQEDAQQLSSSTNHKVTAENSHIDNRLAATQSNTWPNMQKMFQPQFRIMNPNFQAANQVILPMSPSGMGGSYMLGATPAMLPSAPNMIGRNATENNIGYGIPMNIMRYPMQMASPSSIQIAAFPNNNMNFARDFQYRITGLQPTVTCSISSEGNSQDGSTETRASND